ncbi:Two-component sensor histidine kinase, contains HisKA and HATPase domains [Jannaschia faecimaris]|uniref:Two-component sensor histidine kinase, contains HisKA and HATPase domains n=1 Tax=Jannaschia faecimaris TaxID=1244108 RepID=A0A1H3NS92_9RHOB|nr:histidine kinase dimerization/phosphoacceptor domain -containing protein [Jannaschia faecimaris]SDY91791.1 Two-component sensor histidine kinase, contains HisKA and HATPase domains [Jannaschia faecimaris]
MLAPIAENQQARLAAIKRYNLDGVTHAGAFDGLVELAAQICQCPISLVSIVREHDQQFEAVCGLDIMSTGLDSSICSHGILQEDILEIPDTRLDMRTQDNPLVVDVDDPVLFYAGARIITKAGVALGSLCVLDRRPRRLGDTERRALRILADQVMQRLELHEALRNEDAMRREVDHRVKNSLANISAMTRMVSRKASVEVREALESVERRIDVMVALHEDLYHADQPDAPIDVSAYLTRITTHLRDMAPPGVKVDMTFQPVSMIARRASALGVLVNEMISNACKHAFPDGRAGRVQVTGQRTSDTHYEITCSDDGVGIADQGDQSTGLGNRIMEASAAQLGGTLRAGPGPQGYRVELDFPIDLT